MAVNMSKYNVGNAFSAGIGLVMGLTMAQYMSQIMRPPEKTIKQVIICLRCGSKNPDENKFCGQCGQALYPPPPIQCRKCSAVMPSNMKFCGKCGSLLRKADRTRKKRS
jgi:rRNA maturation endonuclease Nob1